LAERRCDVAVIGAGTAGLHAYKAATAAGAEVLLIERGEGGSTCTRNGCMPSKLLLAAARAAEAARTAGRFGIGTGAVAVDGRAVLARVRAERDRFLQSVLDEYHAIPAERRIRGTARFTGPGQLAVGDDAIAARAVVITTGGHATVPEPLAAVADLVRTHETIFEIDDLPEAMAVVGAGPLGLELAQAFARLGVAVTVLDQGEAVGKLVDPEAEAAARAALGRAFDLRLGVEVQAAPAGGRAELSWTGASEGRVTVDLVLAATGLPPALDGLALEKAGIALANDGSPRFDPRTRACDGGAVFVAGDAGGWRPVLHEAARGGRIAGDGAAGSEAPRQLPALSIAFTDPEMVEVGVAFDALPDDARIATVRVADDPRSQIDGQGEGVVRVYADRDGRLVGATVVATGGEHLGHLLALAIDRGMDAAELADQAWYHPTTAEMLQKAARELAG